MNKRGRLAFAQILILLIGFAAVVWEVDVVSGEEEPENYWYYDYDLDMYIETAPETTPRDLPSPPEGFKWGYDIDSGGDGTWFQYNSEGIERDEFEWSSRPSDDSLRGDPPSIAPIPLSESRSVETGATGKDGWIINDKGEKEEVTAYDGTKTVYTDESKIDAAIAELNKQKPTTPGTKIGEKSPDGKHEWDGKEWKPITPPPTSTGSSTGDFLQNKWDWGSGSANFFGHIGDGLGWSLAMIAGVQTLGRMFLNDDEVSSISSASFAGIMAGKASYGLIKEGSWLGGKDGISHAGEISAAIGIAVAAYMIYETWKSEEIEIVTYECRAWEAPVGGEYCEKCNEQQDGYLPCSEYQCRSLGQACQLLNPGTNEEKCTWVNRHDTEYPIIQALPESLLDDYRYSPEKSMSPPDRGVEILYEKSRQKDDCVPAFTAFSFGVELDELAKCKLDYTRKESFEEMNFLFSGGAFRQNHTYIMSLPGSSDNTNLTVENDGEYDIYVRCADANGNYNTANYVFKFCVEQGPDTTPPLIVTTNLLNNMPISYNTENLDLILYVNEPANCKWSHLDMSYDKMETEMSCSSRVREMNAQMLYECKTQLTGIRNRATNDFYFRCKDQPGAAEGDRNMNKESYKFTVIGTQALVISELKPEGTIKGSGQSIQVDIEAETSAGYNEGEATCYYSNTGEDDDYVMFYYEGDSNFNHEHSQPLYLSAGNYHYWVKCIDLGGNTDVKDIRFTVEADATTPMIVRAYYEGNALEVITNEESECVYDTTNCNYLFGDGVQMTTADNLVHSTNWNIDTNFYIKCKDEYDNQPLPNQCNMVVRPVELWSGDL